MTMKIMKWTVDKQEGRGGSSGHLKAFSAGFWGGQRAGSARFWSISASLRLFCITPERCAGPGAPRPSWPCAGAPWCRWNAERFRMTPGRLCSPGAGQSRSVSRTRGSCSCRGKKMTLATLRIFIPFFCTWALSTSRSTRIYTRGIRTQPSRATIQPGFPSYRQKTPTKERGIPEDWGFDTPAGVCTASVFSSRVLHPLCDWLPSWLRNSLSMVS